MSKVPPGAVVGWPFSHDSIPSGWSRVTTLNGRLPRASTSTGDPGGDYSHHHTDPGLGHRHKDAHNHTSTIGSDQGGEGEPTCELYYPGNQVVATCMSHTHGASSSESPNLFTGYPSTLDSSTESFTLPRWEVIWITPTTAAAAPPDGALIYYFGAALPASWTQPDSGKGRYLVGAEGDGGTVADETPHHHTHLHDHSYQAHTHSVPIQSKSLGTRTVHGPAGVVDTVRDPHNHTAVSPPREGGTTSAYSATSEDVAPKPLSTKLAVLAAGAGATIPIGAILPWTGAGAIPERWHACDGDSGTPAIPTGHYVSGATLLSEVGATDGEAQHDHTAAGHKHSMAQHGHSFLSNHANDADILASDHGWPESENAETYHHYHPVGLGAKMVDTTSVPSGFGPVDTVPPYCNVILIQYLGEPPEDPAECEGSDEECPGADEDAPPCGPSRTAANSARVGAAGGPSGGSLTPGLSGYIGGRPQGRWTGRGVNLDAAARLSIGDQSGRATLAHPTTALELSFASGQSQAGPLGWNWTHEYHVTLILQSEAVVDIQHEGGRWDRYTLTDSVWTPEEGRRASLAQDESLWTETTPYGVQYQFVDPGGTSFPRTSRVSVTVDANGNRTTFSYDGENLESVLDGFGQRVTFSYDAGLVSDIIDPSGALTTFSYDPDSQLESVWHPNGARVTYSYNAGHDPVSIQLPPGLGEAAGPITTLSYDGNGRLHTITDPTDRLVRTLTYDVENGRTVIVDARNHVWTSTYAENGMPLTREDPIGLSRANAWTERDATSFDDAREHRWTYTYDDAHRRTGMVSPLLCVHAYTYTLDNMLRAYTDPLTHRTTYDYDGSRNRTLEIHPDEGRVTYSYFANGLLQDEQDARGYLTTYGYDARGNRRTAETPDLLVTTFTYDLGDRLTEAEDPLGHVSTNVYDVMGRLVATVDGEGARTSYSYDLTGRPVEAQDPLEQRSTTQYNSLGQVEAQVDALGYRTSYAYDANGNRTWMQDPLERVTTYIHDDRDRLIAEVNPLGLTTSYDYDGNGNLRATINPLGQRTTTIYDAVNRPTEVVDALGYITTTIYYETGLVQATVDPLERRTTYSYDGMGQRILMEDAANQLTTYVYDLSGSLIETQDPTGYRWTSVYDERNRLIAQVDPLEHRTSYVYDEAGRQVAVIDALAHRTTTEYDRANRPWVVISPLLERTTSVYDPAGQLLATVDARGNITSHSYDEAGRLIEDRDAKGYRTTYIYDPAGQRIAVWDARDHRTTYHYDGAGQLLAQEDALGERTSFSYDPAGRQESVTDPLGRIGTSIYDPVGRLWVSVDPLEHRTTYYYDWAGQQVAVEDALERLTTSSYDLLGRLWTTQNAQGAVTTYHYDAAGRQTVIEDARGNRTSFSYDERGLQTELIDQLDRRITFGYDALGRREWRLDAKGQRTTYHYDDKGQLLEREYSDGSRVTFAYDAVGNRSLMQDLTGRYTYSYDKRNALEVLQGPLGKTYTLSYDARGNREWIEALGGGRATFGYDPLDRIEWLHNPLEERTTFLYDAAGARATQRNANGTWVSYSYDGAGRLERVANLKSNNTTLSSFAYSFDDVGTRTSVMEANGVRVTWSYDELYQLKREQRSGATTYDITYSYDAVGNRLAQERGGVTTSYSYDEANQLEYEATPSARTTFTFDSNGNLAVQQAGSQRTTYSWDLENMCSHIVLPSGGRSTFMYDGDLRRRFASEASSWPRAFVLDGDNVIMELDLGGSVTKAYTVEPAGYGNLISEWYSSMNRSYWFHFDALGTTERITGPSQSVVTTFVNSAFGVPEAVGGPYPSSPPPFRWLGRIGYWWEPDASQYDVRRRRYDPARGRWIGRDVLLNQGTSRFTYAGNSPVALVDPSGLSQRSSSVPVMGLLPGMRAIRRRLSIVDTKSTPTGAVHGTALSVASASADGRRATAYLQPAPLLPTSKSLQATATMGERFRINGCTGRTDTIALSLDGRLKGYMEYWAVPGSPVIGLAGGADETLTVRLVDRTKGKTVAAWVVHSERLAPPAISLNPLPSKKSVDRLIHMRRSITLYEERTYEFSVELHVTAYATGPTASTTADFGGSESPVQDRGLAFSKLTIDVRER